MRIVRTTLLAITLPLAMAAQPASAQATPQPTHRIDLGKLFPADREMIGTTGETIRIATVPGKFEVRFAFDEGGQFLNSVVIESATGRIAGVGSGSSEQVEQDREERVIRADAGPPANYTGIFLLGTFPGGGAIYGEYVRGVRTGTIVVQPDGTIDYYPK